MTPDDWLDAFTPDDLADPELARIDAAVERLVPTVPRRRSRARWIAGVAVVLAAAAVLLYAWRSPPPEPPSAAPAPAPVAAVEPAPPAPAPEIAAPAPLPAHAPAPALVRSSPRPSPRPDAPPDLGPGPMPGLMPSADAVVTVADGVATVRSGLLVYVHDETHEPGVRSVGLGDLPVRVVPLGTAFAVDERRQVGAVRVRAGRVQLVHDDGTVLAELGPGDEAVAVDDLDTAIGVRVVHTSGLPLDAIGAQLPKNCLCHPRDVVAAVAAVRLATSSLPTLSPEAP